MRVGGGVALVGAVLVLGSAAPAFGQIGYWSHPEAIAVAPDNRHVYVGAADGTLALARDSATGALEVAGRFPPMTGPLEVAPDGLSVYGRRPEFQGGLPLVSAYHRDPATGALEAVPVSGWRTSGRVADVAVSPDGATVYATDLFGDELAIFSRAVPSGALTFMGAAPAAPGVTEPKGLVVSPDGRWLYMGAQSSGPDGSGRVVRYERQPDGTLAVAQVADCGTCTGDTLALSPEEWLYVGAPGLSALRWDPTTGELGALGSGPWVSLGGHEPGGAGLAVASDGALYVADTWEDKLHQARPTADGFEFVRTYRDFDGGVQGLRDLRSIALTPDGSHLYAAAGPFRADKSGTVAVFSRDPASGDLTFASLFAGGPTTPMLEVTINGGVEYTDDRRVRVRVRNTSPLGGSTSSPEVEIANDGGFLNARLFMVNRGDTYAWTLDSTGPERLPKTVYARPAWGECAGFPGWRGQSASDTIVLDETRPVVVAARRARPDRVRVRARDRLSGVRRVQIAGRRGARTRWRAYSTRRLYAAPHGRVWVRVRDRAGNHSRWRAVRATRGGG